MLREAKEEAAARILARADLSREMQEALLAAIDYFVDTASREEIATYLNSIVTERVGAPISRLSQRLEGIVFEIAGEQGHGRSGTIYQRTRRHSSISPGSDALRHTSSGKV